MATPDPMPEHCGQCGFDGEEWNDRDTINTIRHIPDLFRLWSAPLSGAQTNQRPDPHTWSAAEYTDHLRETLYGMRFLIDLARDHEGFDLGPALPAVGAGAPRVLDLTESIDALTVESNALHATLAGLDGGEWDASVTIGDHQRTVRWASRHGLHDAWHHLTDIAAIASSLGAGVHLQRGWVVQLSRSTGGVPKLPIDSATVGRRGLAGDVQGTRVHHGRPWQALCFWSAEVIADLVAEGHPIQAGAAENITIAGLDWTTVHAGVLISIGDMVCQLSAPAVPCSKNHRWFADGDSQRISHDRFPGSSRWYASVLTPGTIATGDEIVLSAPTWPSRR